MLDSLIVGVSILIIYFVVFAAVLVPAAAGMAVGQPPPPWYFVVVVLMYLLILVGVALYEILMVAKRGATLGKSVVGIRVLRIADGQLPSVGSAATRWVIPLLGGIACGLGQILVYLSPFFDDETRRQGWHDKAAKTIVVRSK